MVTLKIAGYFERSENGRGQTLHTWPKTRLKIPINIELVVWAGQASSGGPVGGKDRGSANRCDASAERS